MSRARIAAALAAFLLPASPAPAQGGLDGSPPGGGRAK
jgi:hypothetical protein